MGGTFEQKKLFAFPVASHVKVLEATTVTALLELFANTYRFPFVSSGERCTVNPEGAVVML
jgi:hypothetical protein